MLRSTSKIGGTGQEEVSIAAASPLGRMRGVLSVMPPPVMCAAPRSKPAFHQRADRRQITAVDREQRVRHGRPHLGSMVFGPYPATSNSSLRASE